MLGSSYNEEYRVNTVHGALRQKEKGAQRGRWLDGVTASMDLNLRKPGRRCRTEEPGVLQLTDVTESQTQISS